MIRWFAKNHVAANILMLAILISGGYLAWFKLAVEVEPSVEFPMIRVSAPLRGGSPKDVEQKIVLPIEKALADLSGVDYIESYASRGSGSVSVHAISGTDMDKMKNEVESRIDSITIFPNEAEKPRVYVPNTANWREVISVMVYGDLSENDLIAAARQVRDDLTALDGISKVDIQGLRDREITIEIDLEKLNAYGLTVNQLSNAIRQSSVDLSAGSINNNGERILIRSSSQAYVAEQFRDLLISRSNGSEIYLGDIATVKDGFEDEQKIVRYNGQNGILLEVMRLNNENALKIADTVKKYTEQAADKFPEGIHFATWDDESISLKGRMKILFENLFQGALLVLILLGLFLRPKIALWVVVGIPVSFAGAIICMQAFGITANNMSMFGFIIVLGIVVDDAIVTGENIYSKLKNPEITPLDAAVIGTQEVATPVTFGVITTIVAFVPLMFVEGYIGEMAKQIPLVVIPVLIFSLIESKFILPAHLKHLKRNRAKSGPIVRLQRGIADSMEKLVEKVYQPALKFAIHHRYTTVGLFTALFLVVMGYQKTQEFNPTPSTDRYIIRASLDMVNGTPFEETDAKTQMIANAIDSIRDDFVDPGTGESLIQNVVTTVGGRLWSSQVDPTSGEIMVEITPPSQRSTHEGPKNSDIAKAWNEAVGEVQGARSFRIRAQRNNSRHMSDQEEISIMLTGSNEEAKLAYAEAIEAWLKGHENIQSAQISRRTDQREFEINLNAEGREVGLSQEDLARQVRNAFYGTQIQKIQRGEDEIRVMLKLPEDQRTSLHTLETLRISLGDNKTANISQFADIVEGTSPPAISRRDASRIITISATPKPGIKVPNMEKELTEKLNEIARDYSGVSWRYLGTLAEYKETNQRIWTLAGLLGFTLFALLAIPFKSFVQPFYVLLAVPFGVIGAFMGHYIMDIPLSYLSYFGILALAGVVVNDSLVMVDFINSKRLSGESIKGAILAAGSRRFRPIILTSITTFAGLVPIIFEPSIQAQFLIPMAVSLGFGILFATVITLFLIPCAYSIGEDIKGLFGIKGAPGEHDGSTGSGCEITNEAQKNEENVLA
ncbi:multidrug resistance protein MdtB [Rubritalea halochordaticola]|uniref:Multidrug resistance protein MdtB n=1 Tax=Rubritalea halochordaticola TaxID=714537 RepID=A0ABP9UWM7_9BACT